MSVTDSMTLSSDSLFQSPATNFTTPGLALLRLGPARKTPTLLRRHPTGHGSCLVSFGGEESAGPSHPRAITMKLSPPDSSPPFARIEYRFYSNYLLEAMRDVLSAAGTRSWFWCHLDPPHLSTSVLPPTDAGERLRIDSLPGSTDRFKLTTWYPAEASLKIDGVGGQ